MNRLNAPLSVALCLALSSSVVFAQTTPARGAADGAAAAPRAADAQTRAVIDRAQNLFEMGEAAFRQNDLDRARRSFDDAVDAILASNVDIRKNEPLQAYYRELIEKIHHHQMMAQDVEAQGFSEQAYVPAESELATLSDSDLASLGDDVARRRL